MSEPANRTHPPLDILLDTALTLATTAGQLLKAGAGSSHSAEHKAASTDLVTAFDRRAEEIIVAGLRERYPSHRILAEEGGERHGDPQAPCWIVDPLDGTTNFAHGLPWFSVSIACAINGEVELGVVQNPVLGWTFAAIRGRGATLNGQAIEVSKTDALDLALLSTGFPYDRRTSVENNLAQFVAFKRRAQGIRRTGSAALDLALVAAGRFDGYWEMKLQPWDIAAGVLLCQEAGGKVTDWRGHPVNLFRGEVLATNGAIHAPMLEVLGRTHHGQFQL
jgi:myo-inositol-1(or 4)-monophosphatase